MAPTSASTETVLLAALGAAPDPELRARLGPELHDHVGALLDRHVERVAADFGHVRRAERIEELGALLDGHAGPVLLLAPDVPRLAAHHLEAALDDLAAGVVATFAPAMDGRPFLLAFSGVAGLALLAEGIEGLAEAVRVEGGEVGMIRPERRLATLDDARAYAVDPTTPPELRDLLALVR